MSKGKSTQSVTLPAYQEAQAKELFQAGKQLAGQPFVPYTGPRVAGFNPDQLRQFEATRGMFESGQQYDPMAGLQGLANASTPTISPVTGFQGSQIQGIQGPQAAQIGNVQAPQFQGLLSQDIGAYQSPYQQQVIDQSMADIQRQADLSRGQSQSRAIGAGAFGGSRSALLESESQRPFIEQMARTSAGLRQAGFENAQQAAQADLARQQQLGVFSAGQEQQRALEQARLGQQVGLAGYEGDLQRAVEQARLGQQAGLAGQDIQARMNMMQPELEMRNRQQQAGLLGGILGTQQQNLANLGQIGAQQQGLGQAGLQSSYEEFQRALAYGPQQLGLLAAGQTGQTPTTTMSQKTGLGDILGGAAGLLGSAWTGGFNPFGFLR